MKNVLGVKSKQSELRAVTKAIDLNRAVTLYTYGKKKCKKNLYYYVQHVEYPDVERQKEKKKHTH